MHDSTELDDDLRMFQDSVRRMVEKEVAPIAAKIDQDDDMPHSLVPIFGELGLVQIMVPEEYGGPGGTLTMACMAKEESCYANKGECDPLEPGSCSPIHICTLIGNATEFSCFVSGGGSYLSIGSPCPSGSSPCANGSKTAGARRKRILLPGRTGLRCRSCVSHR